MKGAQIDFKMRISIITPDLSHNCLGRAYVLAQLLERNHEIEIVGPQFTDEIWEPIRDAYDYKGVQTSPWIHHFTAAIPKLLEKISGDVVYASKPRMNSYGLCLAKTIGKEYPLILDIDDWESGLLQKGSQALTYIKGMPFLAFVNSFYYTHFLEKISHFADARTVSNHFLEKKFSGTLIPHARDTDYFNPDQFNQQDVREELGLPSDKFLVMFSGTPRPYKGVDDLANAVADIDRDKIMGVVVGGNDSEYVDQIRQTGGDSVLIEGHKQFEQLPKWIAAADVIAVPQRNMPETQGQLPAKVFDAMAMAKPIISTNVSDLPYVLKDCGLIVEPGNPAQLREAIIKLFTNPPLAQELGQAARRRCVERYSYDALAPVIDDVVSSVK